MITLILAGATAGAITTIAGMGGGMVMTLILLLTLPPSVALPLTVPALLFGNLHRVRLYWRAIDRPLALRYAVGGIVGAVLGGIVAAGVPEVVIRISVIGIALLAVGKGMGWLPAFPHAAVGPTGLGVGFISSTSGGGGLIAGPMLLAAGLSGRAYVGTAAVGAAAVHIGRTVGYGLGGWLSPDLLVDSVVLTTALLAGNVVGHRIATVMPPLWERRVELGVMSSSVVLAVAGLA